MQLLLEKHGCVDESFVNQLHTKEYKGLKEGYVSDFGDFMLFEEESFNPYAPAKKKVLSFEDFLKTKK